MDGLWIFNLPRDVCVTDLSRQVSGGGRYAVRGPLRASRERLDTFDWRLSAAGLILEYESAAGVEPRLRLLDEAAVPGMLEVRAPRRPGFATDLPAAALRRRLERIMDVRTLLPRATSRGSLHEIQVQDSRDKTVARVHLWRPSRRGDCVARVQALRGYEARGRRTAGRLEKLAGARSLEHDPLWQAVDDGGVRPGEYPGWGVAGLAAGMRADDATQRALEHFRRVMDLNLPGLLADLDSEFLHDFRVGLRRTRTLLRRVDGLFPQARLAPFSADLTWLSAVTGPARDADVHCLVFADYAAAIDPRHTGALESLVEHVRQAQVDAHQALVGALDTPRFRRRWRAWAGFLARPMPRASRQPRGPLPVEDVAARAIEKAVRRVRRKGRRIDAASPPEAYHDLRKAGKDLRYLIDLYAELFNRKALKSTLSHLKKLQDVLGEHQDLDVHRATLIGFHARMSEAGQLSGETHAAMEHLVAELGRRSAESRERFSAPFEAFLESCPRKPLCPARS